MEIEPCIETFTGRKFHPLRPMAADVHLPDIAHALALKCRFTGHCRAFYSIAQHSVLVSRVLVPSPLLAGKALEPEARALALCGLLHDAAEAYLPDVATQLKAHIKNFKAIELMVETAIAEHFDLRYPWPGEVKKTDWRLLLTEARELMHSGGADWPRFGAEPFAFRIIPQPPAEAERSFLERFEELTK